MIRTIVALLRDQSGNAMVEYAVVAASIALPLIGVAYAISQGAGSGLTHTTSGLSNLGASPP